MVFQAAEISLGRSVVCQQWLINHLASFSLGKNSKLHKKLPFPQIKYHNNLEVEHNCFATLHSFQFILL